MPRFFRLIALVCVLVLAGVACGEQRDTGFPEPKAETQEEGHGGGATRTEGPVELTGPIDVGDPFFDPKEAKVAVGTEVVWEQSGSAPHNVVADDDSFNSHPDCKGSDTAKCMGKGDEFRYAFEKKGEFKYYCVIHGGPGGAGMAGTIIVE